METTPSIQNQTSLDPVSPPALSSPPKNNSKILIIPLSLLFATSLSVIGILYLQNRQLKQAKVLTQLEVNPTKTTIQPTIDPITDWKTFSDSKYEFSFKYPQNWKIQTGPSPEVFVVSPKSDPTSVLPPTQIKFEIVESAENTAEDYLAITYQNWSWQNKKTSQQTLAGKTAEILEGNLLWANDDEYWSKVYVIDLGNNNFFSAIEYDTQDQENSAIYSQILSSFKFLE